MARFTTATPGQINYINSLLSERGLSLDIACIRIFSHDDVVIERGYNGTASKLIDGLKNIRRPETERPALPALDSGMYKVGQEIFKVKISHATGKPYAEILCHDAIHNGNYADAAVWFEYAPGAILKHGITQDHRMTVEQCAEFGVLFGTCCVCARTLTNPKSIAKGIGPVCEKKV